MRIIIYPETWRSANSYLIQGQYNYLIDPSLGPEKIGFRPDFLIATHGHFDHISACDIWRKENSAELYISAEDAPKLDDSEANCSTLFCQPSKYEEANYLLGEEEFLKLEEDLRFRILKTPGHTSGSICLLLESRWPKEVWEIELAGQIDQETEDDEDFGLKDEPRKHSDFIPIALFTGDTIFADSIGRMDLATGDPEEMRSSLDKFLRWTNDLSRDLLVLPGHGRIVRLGELLTENPYLLDL